MTKEGSIVYPHQCVRFLLMSIRHTAVQMGSQALTVSPQSHLTNMSISHRSLRLSIIQTLMGLLLIKTHQQPELPALVKVTV